jgi:Fe2+ or Zn2+ uptake regulation protein
MRGEEEMEQSGELVRALDEYLTQQQLYFGKDGRLIAQTFSTCTGPVTATELLYEVKRFNPLISGSNVRHFLHLLVDSGLARKIEAERHGGRGPARFENATDKVAEIVEVQQCSHQHLVCKDCGAIVGVPGDGSTEGIHAGNQRRE